MAYGACDRPDADYAQRYTFVIGPEGKIEQAIDTKQPAEQAEQLLRTL